MSPLARFVVTLALGASGCSGCVGGSTWHVAVGGQGEVPRWNGECDEARAENDGAFTLRNGVWRAERPGRVRIPCAQGAVVLEARAVGRLTLEGPTALENGAAGHYHVRADDEGGAELTVGSSSDVRWTLGPGLREGSRCNHMLGSCLGSWQEKVHADAPGATWVEAAFAGRTARMAVTVGPAR